MAGTSLLTLIDDIATLLDDVAAMSKVAAKKTAGVIGDDLALNAKQVTGLDADRELPVVWQVAKGSFINKLILVPSALAISAFLPWLVMPLLMLGGFYLCFEGAEKLVEKFHGESATEAAPITDLKEYEALKVKGAIRTDFILSAEIIVIALGTVAAANFTTQLSVLSVIALGMTIGVYGLVAGIIKLDDAGLYLRFKAEQTGQKWQEYLGTGLLKFAPVLMKFLSVAGTIAMFLVGGGIIEHGIAPLHQLMQSITQSGVESLGSHASWLIPLLTNGVVGVLAGLLVVLLVSVFSRFKGK